MLAAALMPTAKGGLQLLVIRRALTNAIGLIRSETVTSFMGEFDVSAAASSTNPQAGDGTAGFYVRATTVLIV